MFNAKTWLSGERSAQNYLKKQKYKILETNFKTNLGEIDIIAKEKDYFVFIEVKSRTSKEFGLPREAVTEFKQNKIKQVAKQYLIANKIYPSSVRFDVIEVLNEKIEHIKNAF